MSYCESEISDEDWSVRKYRFLFASIAPAGDIISLWRYPFLVRKHGGIVLFSVLIIYVLIGWPIYLFELSLGYVSAKKEFSGHCLHHLMPLLKGLDIASAFYIIASLLYQMTVISWTLLYLFTSVQETVPWSVCENITRSTDCVIQRNQTCKELDTYLNCSNLTEPELTTTKYFFNITSPSSDLQQLGNSSWALILCLLFAWFVVYLNTVKKKLTLKKRKFIPTVLIVLLFTALFAFSFKHKGNMMGIDNYLKFDKGRLGDPLLWNDSLTQVMLSLNIGSGFIAFSSKQSNSHEKIIKTSIGIIAANFIISFYGGLVIYSWFGVLANASHITFTSLLSADFGFPFIILSSAIATLPIPPIWSIAIFLIMSLTSLDRIEKLLLTFLSTMHQLFSINSFKDHSKISILIIYFLLFCSGILFTYGIGYHILFILDCWVLGYTALLLSVLQIACIYWLYGFRIYFEELYKILKEKMELKIFKMFWCVITPAISIALLIFTCTNSNLPNLGKFYYGRTAQIVGWCLVMLILSPCFIYLSYMISKFIWILKHSKRELTEVNTVSGNVRNPITNFVFEQQTQQESSESPLMYHVLLIKSEKKDSSLNIPYGFLLSPSKHKIISKTFPNLLNYPEIIVNSVSASEPSTSDFYSISQSTSHNGTLNYTSNSIKRHSEGEINYHKIRRHSDYSLMNHNAKGVVNEAYCSED
ncbi:sodium- and chloride-dependent betaine transporter-like isoform X2 [Centruroides vittatus]